MPAASAHRRSPGVARRRQTVGLSRVSRSVARRAAGWTRRRRQRRGRRSRRCRAAASEPDLCAGRCDVRRRDVSSRRLSSEGQFQSRQHVAQWQREAPLPPQHRRSRGSFPGDQGPDVLWVSEFELQQQLARQLVPARQGRHGSVPGGRVTRAADGVHAGLSRSRKRLLVPRPLHDGRSARRSVSRADVWLG